MWQQLKKTAGKYFPDHIGTDVSGVVGYHGTGASNAEEIMRSGFNSDFIHPETFERDYSNFLAMLPDDFQDKMSDMEDDGVSEEERAELVRVAWDEKFGHGTIIWLGDFVTADNYGEVVFKVTLPEGSVDMGSDYSGGSVYWVPVSPIPPSCFKVVEGDEG